MGPPVLAEVDDALLEEEALADEEELEDDVVGGMLFESQRYAPSIEVEEESRLPCAPRLTPTFDSWLTCLQTSCATCF